MYLLVHQIGSFDCADRFAYPYVKPSQTKEQLSCRIIKRSHAASRGNTHTMSGKSSSLYALHPVSKCGESNISSKESATQSCNTQISRSGLQNCSGLHGAKCTTTSSYKMRKISIEPIKKKTIPTIVLAFRLRRTEKNVTRTWSLDPRRFCRLLLSSGSQIHQC